MGIITHQHPITRQKTQSRLPRSSLQRARNVRLTLFWGSPFSVTAVWVVDSCTDSVTISCDCGDCENAAPTGDGSTASAGFSTGSAGTSLVPVAVATAAATWTGATGSAFAAQVQLINSIAATAAVTCSSVGTQL